MNTTYGERKERKGRAGRMLLRIAAATVVILALLCLCLTGGSAHSGKTRAAAVLTGSMEPTLSEGDLIVIRSGEYREGDIVVFQDGSIPVAHRITGIDGDTVTTKGDANNIADRPISMDSIQGRVVFSVPLIGRVLMLMRTPAGALCTAGIALTLILLSFIGGGKNDTDTELERLRAEAERLRLQNGKNGMEE